MMRYAWLEALERSGSASPDTGWEPKHIGLWRGDALVAAVPAYRKHHSLGEYVYDFGWAAAAERAGVAYYPKYLLGVPISPIAGQRLLTSRGEDAALLQRALLEGAEAWARANDCSGVHAIFLTEGEASLAESAGWIRRTTAQFHWRNPGYRHYDDYLSRFTSKRRHQLRRERHAAAQQGIEIRTRRGSALGPSDAEMAYRFYEATVTKNTWGRKLLNEEFFRRVFQAFPENVELVEAVRGGRVIAGAFNLVQGDVLYGRYWGCFEEHPFLHFNVCMYHAIDECIQLGRREFQPGAGGEHKIARGFEPTAIESAHVLFHPGLSRA
ncbi:MAG: GNAT family N-acetyltransferase, partial [Myxococcaceae bacterium]